LKSIEGLGLTEYGNKMSEDIDSKDQREATTTQGTTRVLLCCDEILMERKNLLSVVIVNH